VRKTYQNQDVDTSLPALPDTVNLAVAELAGELREGLLALAVGTGMQVLAALMEEDVTAACGPKGRHDPQRRATRHGHERGSVTLGGRRVPVQRPRMRAADGCGELPVPTYELFSSTEVLGRLALERMLAGLSTRRYPVGLEPVGSRAEQTATSTSKSAVSRRFVAATETALAELLAADLSGLDLVALMVDGVHFGEHCCVVALGIDGDGVKHPLALAEGSTENATLVTDLLVGLRERGLDVTRPLLVVIDGSKALACAVRDVFDHPVLQRCQLHRACNETSCSFRMRWRMMWYAHRRRGPRSACPAVRGAVAASERTSATSCAGDGGSVAGARRGPRGRRGDRSQRYHGAQGRGRVGVR
jgi:putative transposase